MYLHTKFIESQSKVFCSWPLQPVKFELKSQLADQEILFPKHSLSKHLWLCSGRPEQAVLIALLVLCQFLIRTHLQIKVLVYVPLQQLYWARITKDQGFKIFFFLIKLNFSVLLYFLFIAINRVELTLWFSKKLL